MTSQKVVVLGGTGFIGDYLIKHLNKTAGIHLTMLINNNPPKESFPKVKYINISKLNIEVISADCLIILTQPNIELLTNILKRIKNLKKIIYASTLLLYPDSDALQNESSPINPLSDYEKAKAYEEELLSCSLPVN